MASQRKKTTFIAARAAKEYSEYDAEEHNRGRASDGKPNQLTLTVRRPKNRG